MSKGKRGDSPEKILDQGVNTRKNSLQNGLEAVSLPEIVLTQKLP